MSGHDADHCAGGPEAHDAHVDVNGECPWPAKPTAPPTTTRVWVDPATGRWGRGPVAVADIATADLSDFGALSEYQRRTIAADLIERARSAEPPPPRDGAIVMTCLVCKVAWDMDHDPPGCGDPDHQQATNSVSFPWD